jgi:hypothetical protein
MANAHTLHAAAECVTHRGFYCGASFPKSHRPVLTEGHNMTQPPKQPFDSLPGFPAPDDKEVPALMEAVDRIPREGADQFIRSFLRAALGWERSGDSAHLTGLAEDTLFTMRLRSDPQCKEAFEDEKPPQRARREELLDVEEALARQSMA